MVGADLMSNSFITNKVNSFNFFLFSSVKKLIWYKYHKQFERGELKVKPPDIGGPIEDEANAKAGQFIKMYAKIDEDIYNVD